jgi:hypothetical protein
METELDRMDNIIIEMANEASARRRVAVLIRTIILSGRRTPNVAGKANILISELTSHDVIARYDKSGMLINSFSAKKKNNILITPRLVPWSICNTVCYPGIGQWYRTSQ